MCFSLTWKLTQNQSGHACGSDQLMESKTEVKSVENEERSFLKTFLQTLGLGNIQFVRYEHEPSPMNCPHGDNKWLKFSTWTRSQAFPSAFKMILIVCVLGLIVDIWSGHTSHTSLDVTWECVFETSGRLSPLKLLQSGVPVSSELQLIGDIFILW